MNNIWTEEKLHIVIFLHWLVKQDILISETANGYVFKSSTLGGKTYTAEELYNNYKKETDGK